MVTIYSTHQVSRILIPAWLYGAALALGVAILILLFIKRSSLKPGYFAPLLVTVILFLVGTVGASIIFPSVDIVSKYSSGEAEDNGTTLEVGEATIQ